MSEPNVTVSPASPRTSGVSRAIRGPWRRRLDGPRVKRGVTDVLAAALALFLSGTALAFSDDELRTFARGHSLQQADAFAETVESLRQKNALPPHYVTKREAEKLGWKPGQDLCRVAPGKAIGGDNFGNREKRLPEAQGRRWREADLDYACGKRNAKRLVWSSDGLIFLTTDHYGTFKEVPK
jgi:ribonuclease T1